MNIRDVNNGAYRPESIRNGSVADSSKVEEAGRSGPATAAADAKDRVELSSTARPVDEKTFQELVFARKALLGIPPLSDERVADILRRIQEGYYSQPEVLKEITERFTRELSGAL